jgi:hypothetical protein
VEEEAVEEEAVSFQLSAVSLRGSAVMLAQ